MKIGIVGVGYVGIVTAAVLADNGNTIIGIDKDEGKVAALSAGKPTLYEPKLEGLLKKNAQRMEFSSDYGRLSCAEAIFLIVPTPTVKGKIDLSYVLDAARKVSTVNKSAKLIIKSTVVPGTARMVARETGMAVVSNPEFTREGSGVDDTAHPDRIVIGSAGGESGKLVESIWSFTKAPVVMTTNENAELIKYASNAFLATKISFINEIANLCERIPGCDVEVVAKAMGLDKRIAPYFLRAGIGYGGSCFPKDTRALAAFAREKGERMTTVEAAIRVNNKRVDRVIGHVKAKMGRLEGLKVGVLGATFKENTDDMRESQAVRLIERLKRARSTVTFYDPFAKPVRIRGVERAQSKERCIEASDIVIVTTEWDEFRGIGKLAGDKPVIDARRILNRGEFRNLSAIGLGDTNAN